MKNVIEVLRERGLIEDMTSPDIEARLNAPCVVYAGFDPTSSSLQAGNLVTIMVLAHFQRCGHRVIALVGGATGLIGDPSGKTSERQLLAESEVRRNADSIRENLGRFLDFDHPTAPATIVNNLDWLSQFSFLEFLRDVGKHFRMGTMLGRESVRARLASESGMSYTEFSYQMLQAYDFLKLFDEHGCAVQVGGSDQWGNITAGIDLVRRLRSEEVFGVTTPLVCDSNGQKFGKSEGNAVYLNADRTSIYDFYQFFVRSADADVGRYLRTFSFLEVEEIEALEAELETAPEKRSAQKRLAECVTQTVHGDEGLETALRASAVMFGESMEGLDASMLMGIFADVPSHEMPLAEVAGRPVVEVAAECGLSQSRGAARRLVESGGLYVNNVRVAGTDATISDDDLVDGRLLVLRSGKKNYRLVSIA